MHRPRTAFAVAAIAILALVGACSDQMTAPKRSQNVVRAPNPDVIIDNIITDGLNMDVDFTVTSTGGWYLVGPHKLFFPANTICEPNSTYGPAEWDQPCTPAVDPVKFHAAVRYDPITGKPSVDFTPSIRFVPSDDSSQWVWMYFYENEARAPMSDVELQDEYKILWSPAFGLAGIDESLTDSTLKTNVMSNNGMVYRRIKHFSGYQVGSGSESPPDEGV